MVSQLHAKGGAGKGGGDGTAGGGYGGCAVGSHETDPVNELALAEQYLVSSLFVHALYVELHLQ